MGSLDHSILSIPTLRSKFEACSFPCALHKDGGYAIQSLISDMGAWCLNLILDLILGLVFLDEKLAVAPLWQKQRKHKHLDLPLEFYSLVEYYNF